MMRTQQTNRPFCLPGLQTRSLSRLLPALIFSVFLYVAFGMVFSRGVCCADDAYAAVIAKNLTHGLGYSSTVQEARAAYSITMFDPRIGVGPTIILPAAFVIALVGNTYWAPGVAIVLLNSILLLSNGFLLHKVFPERTGFTSVVLVFFILAYAWMVYHMEQWYALLGEVPAALLILLAILVFLLRESRANLFISGVLFSLATLAKLIALLPFASFMLFIALNLLWTHRKNINRVVKPLVFDFGTVLLGFLIPYMLFEFWKILSLEIPGYIEYWSRYIKYVTEKGRGVSGGSLSIALSRLEIIQNRFGIYYPAILGLMMGLGIALRKDSQLLRFFYLILIISVPYGVYWFLFSTGWPRYFIIALILKMVFLSVPFMSPKMLLGGKLFYSLVLVLLISLGMNKISPVYPFRGIELYQPTSNVIALVEAGAQLSTQLDRTPFLTQWWATSADLEYILDQEHNFTTYWDPKAKQVEKAIIAVNTKFILSKDEVHKRLLNHCVVTQFGQYLVGDCELVVEQ
jgi:hypothetical protein